MSILPGVRELRTPLASGYLWLTATFLAFGEYLPRTRPALPLGAIAWDLGSHIGKAGILAGLTFIAYLVGAVLELRVIWLRKLSKRLLHVLPPHADEAWVEATATRVQNFDSILYAQYDRLAGEAALRLNVAPPIAIALIAATWRLQAPAWACLILLVASLVIGTVLVWQSIDRAGSAIRLLVQADVMGALQKTEHRQG